MPHLTVSYNDKLCIDISKLVFVSGEFSNLLAAIDSAKMADKKENRSCLLPQAGELQEFVMFIFYCQCSEGVDSGFIEFHYVLSDAVRCRVDYGGAYHPRIEND